VNDGLLDISILPALQEVVGTLKNQLTGGFGIDSMFVRARLPRFEIKVSEGLYINLDGEPLEGDNLRFSIRPAALLVHLPEDSPLLRAREVPSHQG
jgi:diacylglycerol kinase family enzyme